MTTNDGNSGARWSGRYRRPYVLTGGRTKASRADLALETLVAATPLGAALPPPERQKRQVVELTATIVSVAEISARLEVPLGVAKVLVDDLANDGYLEIHPPAAASTGDQPDLPLLERVLNGLRAL